MTSYMKVLAPCVSRITSPRSGSVGLPAEHQVGGVDQEVAVGPLHPHAAVAVVELEQRPTDRGLHRDLLRAAAVNQRPRGVRLELVGQPVGAVAKDIGHGFLTG
jgi:hypothetical protein